MQKPTHHRFDENDEEEGGEGALFADLKNRRIYLTGAIVEATARTFLVALHAIDDRRGPMTLYLSTQGGEVDAGLLIYDAMRAAKNEIRVVGYGVVASSGAVILQGGAHRTLSPHCQFMIHEASGGLEGPIQHLRTELRELVRRNDTIAGIMAERSKLPLAQVRKLLRKTSYMTAEEAVQYGFADSVLKKEPPCRRS